MKIPFELVKSDVAEGAGNTYSATNHPLVLARSGFVKANQFIPALAAERAFTRWVESSDGCKISTYSVASHGYAQVGWMTNEHGHGGTTAHRAAWVHVNGQIPAGMTVDHICKNRQCVNTDHLRLLSNFENARRTSGRDWPLGECANGHPNSELVEASGKLVCRPCAYEWRTRWVANNPEKVLEIRSRSNAKRPL